MISTVETGQFPITSGHGNTQIMVMYVNGTNIINAIAIKVKHKEYLIKGYDKLHNNVEKAGITMVIKRIDNEISQELIEAIEGKTYNINSYHPEITKHYQWNNRYKLSKIISFQFYIVLMIVT